MDNQIKAIPASLLFGLGGLFYAGSKYSVLTLIGGASTPLISTAMTISVACYLTSQMLGKSQAETDMKLAAIKANLNGINQNLNRINAIARRFIEQPKIPNPNVFPGLLNDISPVVEQVLVGTDLFEAPPEEQVEIQEPVIEKNALFSELPMPERALEMVSEVEKIRICFQNGVEEFKRQEAERTELILKNLEKIKAFIAQRKEEREKENQIVVQEVVEEQTSLIRVPRPMPTSRLSAEQIHVLLSESFPFSLQSLLNPRIFPFAQNWMFRPAGKNSWNEPSKPFSPLSSLQIPQFKDPCQFKEFRLPVNGLKFPTPVPSSPVQAKPLGEEAPEKPKSRLEILQKIVQDPNFVQSAFHWLNRVFKK